MDINIEEVISNIRSVDDDSLLTPRVLERILRAVQEVINERELHDARIGAEQRISSGVAEELREG